MIESLAIFAPFTPRQVRNFTAWQTSPHVQPWVCDCGTPFEAYSNGLACISCHIVQQWGFAFVAQGDVLRNLEQVSQTPIPVSDHIDSAQIYCVGCRGPVRYHGKTPGGTKRLRCARCNVTFLSATRRPYVRGNVELYNGHEVRKPAILEAARLLFIQGYSHRRVAKRLQINVHTARRYRQLLFPSNNINCACGENSKHQGWCWWRYQQSPNRQRFMAWLHENFKRTGTGRKRTKVTPMLAYPFVATVTDEHDLLLAVNALVPKQLPYEVRADVCQEICIAIIAGETTLDEAKQAVPRYIKAVYKMNQTGWGFISIDAPIFGDGTRTLAETLEG